MESRDTSSQEQEGLAGQGIENLGEPMENESENFQDSDGQSDESGSSKKRPTGWERLKQKTRSQDREIRELRATLGDMQSRMQPEQPQQPDHMMGDSYNGNDMAGTIHKAVSLALGHRDETERKAREAEKMAHVHKQYGELQKHLDHTADKYDDFDDMVRGHDAPFTEHMRDAALLLPRTGAGSAGEVLYNLGKNRETLEKIKNLHPLDQAAEMVKLSHALMNGASEKRSNTQSHTMGGIKNNPMTNTAGISEKTSVGELRRRMKAGWK